MWRERCPRSRLYFCPYPLGVVCTPSHSQPPGGVRNLKNHIEITDSSVEAVNSRQPHLQDVAEITACDVPGGIKLRLGRSHTY
eukprot:2060649-Prymnesium_polylepis.1